jgi:hypothetical protein
MIMIIMVNLIQTLQKHIRKHTHIKTGGNVYLLESPEALDRNR